MMAGVMSLLPDQVRKTLQRGKAMVGEVGHSQSVTGACASDGASLVDSHFHLDKLLARSKMTSLSQLEKVLSPKQCVSKLVAVYCFPSSWPSEEAHQDLAKDQRLFFTYGIHPRQASSASKSAISAVSTLLQRPRVVALGEVGLDYSRHDSRSERLGQQKTLEKLLPLAAQYQLPVVFHSRGRTTGLATPDCVRLTRRHLPSDHPLHVHCFSDGLTEMRLWQGAFTNVFFGFTATLLSPDRDSQLEDVVRHLPQDRLLLETDSPYLLPPGSSTTGYNVPWNISHVAARIAELRGTTSTSIQEVTAANAARLYHF